MKKLMVIVVAVLVFSTIASAQSFVPKTYVSGSTGGIPFNIDKLGAHQNGGRGCVGCHAPHSGARGNGGTLQWDGTQYVSVAVTGDSGDEALWGQDLGPIYGNAFGFPDPDGTGASTGSLTITAGSPDRLITGVAMCLSCHDGNLAKGAMMTNQSFEQTANLLPAGYGTQPIPTLLGADGGAMGNYKNDHPVGPDAKLGLLSGIKASTGFFALGTSSSGVPILVKGANFPNSTLAEFAKNYYLPLSINARAGAGWALDTATTVDDAYIVCTTCHTPHTMYTASVNNTGTGATGFGGSVNGTAPSYFFVAAAYNPGANVADGKKASSATQFCRQCHFTGAGGSNEASGISIPTAW